MSASEPVIAIEGMSKVHGLGAGGVRALDGVNLAVHDGEIVALRGPSGSGKSTLLNILGCLDRPTEGSYRLGNLDVSTLDRAQQAWVRLHFLGFIFQSFHLISDHTALENIVLPLRYAGVSRTERKERAEALLKRVGLAERSGHRPSQLSGGEKQRVAIARAIACRPRVLLADEPTGALDTKTGEEILELLLELRERDGLTILLVTHDPRVAERADRQVFMQDGRLSSSPPSAANHDVQ
ncbi:MAG TPA: ABC transporter ATP-binding protein [Polyangiaceae bacterium]|nr:ABC transporter ATP-binding protein [Polyangiaceae bacterium]